MIDWRVIHERLTTEQGRIENGPILQTGRGAFRILFYAMIMLIEDRIERGHRFP